MDEEYVELERTKDDEKKKPAKRMKQRPQAEKSDAVKEAFEPPKPAKPVKVEMAKTMKKLPGERKEEGPERPAEAEEAKKPKPKSKPAKPREGKAEKIRDHVETDVDKLYEIVRDKGILKVKEASKILSIDMDQVEEWGRILEEHKLVRLRYPPVGEPVLILKRFTTDSEKLQKLKGGKKLKPKRRVFIINIIILIFFLAVIAIFTVRIPTIRITYVQAYLAVGAIIIIGAVFVFRAVRGRKNAGKKDAKSEEKSGEKAD